MTFVCIRLKFSSNLLLCFYLSLSWIGYFNDLNLKKIPENKLPRGQELFHVIDAKRSDNTVKYMHLMGLFSVAVVLKKNMNDGLVSGKTWSEIVTASDEAFVLVCLENSWNMWTPKDYHITDNDEYYCCGKNTMNQCVRVNYDGNDKPKFRWSTEHVGGNWVQVCGWAQGGIKHYEELR